MSVLVQLKRHVTRLRGCAECPDMIGPVVSGGAVVSPVMLVGQAPGNREGPAGKPFAWTAGKTMFGWFAGLGIDEDHFRSHVYMAAVCRCFPGKAEGGGDRVPSPEEVARCSRHLHAEARLLQPRLVIPVGKLAIAQLFPDAKQLVDVVGEQRRAMLGDHAVDVIALPHPSGASTWHRTEPGKTLLVRALAKIAQHEAWQSIQPTEDERRARMEREAAAALEAGLSPNAAGDRVKRPRVAKGSLAESDATSDAGLSSPAASRAKSRLAVGSSGGIVGSGRVRSRLAVGSSGGIVGSGRAKSRSEAIEVGSADELSDAPIKRKRVRSAALNVIA